MPKQIQCFVDTWQNVVQLAVVHAKSQAVAFVFHEDDMGYPGALRRLNHIVENNFSYLDL